MRVAGFERPRVDSHLGSMGEGGGRRGGWVGVIAQVHGCDETAVDGEYVEDFAVEKNFALQALDELVDSDADFASGVFGY